MARVDVFEGGSVAPAESTGARFQSQDFGPGIGAGIERLGEVGSQAAEILNRVGELHDEASVKEATNQINGWYADAAYTGQSPYYNQRGKAALEAQGTITTGLDTQIKDVRKGLQNERQRRMFDDAVNPQRTEWGTQIAKHAMTETRTYAANESAARAGMTAEMAGLTYTDNPKEGEQHLATMRAEIASRGGIEGWGPEQIAAEQLKATSGVYQDVGLRLASEGDQGPELARAFINAHGDSMTNDARERVLTNARVRQDALEAEQRRLAAEQRRADSEAKRDARDRVESAMGRIKDGLPLSPDEYTAAVSDAKLTEDPNLVKRVEEGQFTNNLSIQHRNDTPTQLQDRVNELSASITKAGAKAEPKQILERDHLQQMFNQSNAQLNSDPLSWGASHLGIKLQTLNLDDPSSIANRVQAATQVARQTGHAAQPLTPAEAAAFAPQWKNGDINQKSAMVVRLARFGNLAGSAAQQIAPNDNGLVNLLGLATHQNQGVGMSRVNQILTGYEAIKTKPKLVDKDQSLRTYNQFVGGSLQFLPGVKDGVYTNAKALLASEANEAGVSEWPNLDGRAWFKAVNSALGAYTKNGVQYGGLSNFNGAPMVLPENMTQTDFEGRVSRANGPQFRSAQNGVPVLGNGQSPSATDLKKMQWVPSNDGIYRLSDGHSFLHTADGGFYEIDVRKLPSGFDAQLAAHGYTRR